MSKKEKNNQMEKVNSVENEKLPRWFKWVYTGRGLAYTINVVLMLQVTYYCTDILGMPAGLVGALLLASKIVDALTDVIFGFIIDKTKSRWGKGRPYDLFVPILWIGTVLLFSAPNWGITGKAIYIFILYAICNSVCATFLLASDPVYQSRAILSDKNRMFISTFQGIFAMLAATAVGIVVPQLIKTMGTTKSGWTMIAVLFAVPLTIIGSLRMLFIKEKISIENTESREDKKLSIKEGFSLVFRNKLVIVFGILTLCSNAISAITTATATYYFKWIFGDVGMASMVSLPTLLTPVFLIFAPLLCKKFGTGKVLSASMICSVAGFTIRMIFGANLTTILLGTVLVAIGVIPVGTLVNIYEMECMDYGEWKLGNRVEGMITSTIGFMTKVGSAVGSGLLGIMMAMSGYVSSEAAVTQSDSAILMIKLLFNLVPLVISAVAFFVSLNYTIDKDRAAMKAALHKE